MSACKHRVSRSISLPSRGSFHLSLTVLITIGHQVVFSLMGWSPLIHTRFHVSRTTLDTVSLSSLILQDSHLLWFAFPDNSSSINNGLYSPNPRFASKPGLGSSYFARHYFRNRVFFFFLQVLRCFSSLRSPPIHYFTHVWITRFFFLAEFPHSDICGSQDICSLPQLFAAYHVLLRLLVPRYPPYALCSLTCRCR